jgi:hypothetical protein
LWWGRVGFFFIFGTKNKGWNFLFFFPFFEKKM